MIQKLLASALLCLASAQALADNTYSIFVSRHAEKAQSDDRNPPLSICGIQRAQNLATMLQHHSIQAVYSSEYTRTRKTAAPTATAHKVSIQSYDPRSQSELVARLSANKQTALITGHSNTVPALVNALSGQKLEDLDEKDYGKLWQLTFKDGALSSMNLWQVPAGKDCK